MCGTEYDFGPQGDVEKIHAAPLCRKRTGLYARKVSGSVFVFFMDPREGTCEKGRRCSVEEGTFDEEGLHIPRYYYPLFIKETGGLLS